MERTLLTNQQFEEERALYASDGIELEHCQFDGPADGESALKESKNIIVKQCYFNLRYPFWHDINLEMTECEMTSNCRAALWYTSNASIRDSKLHGIKALRECDNIRIDNCDIISPEFGWSVRGLNMENTKVQSEYFMMRAEKLHFAQVSLKGKYSFQYICDSEFVNCNFDTKDAFWHAKNIVVRDSVIKGEYLGWYCENVTFENCTIIGTQPLCYCKGLKLIDCKMVDADLAFEKSEVEATLLEPMISIKNPKSGTIVLPKAEEVIMDDPQAKGKIVFGE